MPDTHLELQTGSTTSLNVSGNGSILIGPSQSGERWEVTSTSVNVSTNTREPVCTLYHDFELQSKRIDGTFTGSNDTSDTSYTIRAGQKLLVVWSGGDAGAIASVTLYGSRYYKGRRMY